MSGRSEVASRRSGQVVVASFGVVVSTTVAAGAWIIARLTRPRGVGRGDAALERYAVGAENSTHVSWRGAARPSADRLRASCRGSGRTHQDVWILARADRGGLSPGSHDLSLAVAVSTCATRAVLCPRRLGWRPRRAPRCSSVSMRFLLRCRRCRAFARAARSRIRSTDRPPCTRRASLGPAPVCEVARMGSAVTLSSSRPGPSTSTRSLAWAKIRGSLAVALCVQIRFTHRRFCLA